MPEPLLKKEKTLLVKNQAQAQSKLIPMIKKSQIKTEQLPTPERSPVTLKFISRLKAKDNDLNKTTGLNTKSDKFQSTRISTLARTLRQDSYLNFEQ